MRSRHTLPAIAAGLALAGCVAGPSPVGALTVPQPPAIAASPATPAAAGPSTQCGGASWYAMTGRTASGERASPTAMTAAHRSLPFGTRVRVTNLRNGRSVVVRVNDRGPFVAGRIIDVSKAAAARLGFVSTGTARVRVERAGGAGRLRASGACS